MKNFILRLSVMGLAAAAGCVMGCQSSGCGGTNINSNTPSGPNGMSCGQGTYLSGTQCLPVPAAGSNATPTKAISN
jgi:hypothetical protein